MYDKEAIKKITVAFGEEKIGHITDEEKLIAKKLRSHIKLNHES
jgi:hypothetical protein